MFFYVHPGTGVHIVVASVVRASVRSSIRHIFSETVRVSDTKLGGHVQSSGGLIEFARFVRLIEDGRLAAILHFLNVRQLFSKTV